MPDATPTPTPPPDVNVPEGYVLLNKAPSELWAKSVLDKLNALNEEADARNPDLQDMYIYNDFYSYACINLIEGELKAFAALAKAHGAGARASVEALEALTLWMAFEQAYSMVDDGECFEALVRCFGAAWHSVALALQTDGTLSADYLPNIANVLLAADALLTELNSIGDKITNAGTSIRVMLARAGLPHEPKKEIVARPPKGARSEDDDDDEDDEDSEEERNPEPPRKKKKGSELDIPALAKMPHAAAEKQLFESKALSSYDFTKLFNSYKRSYCRPEQVHGKGFNIKAWPAAWRRQHSFEDNED